MTYGGDYTIPEEVLEQICEEAKHKNIVPTKSTGRKWHKSCLRVGKKRRIH